MRRFIICLLLSGLVSTSIFADNRVGDADNNGAVAPADAALVQSRLFGTVGASQVSPLALADADSDLDIADMMLVAQAANSARVIDNPALSLIFTPPSPVDTVSGQPAFVETFSVASPLPAVTGLVDGLAVHFAIQPASTSTLSSPSSSVTGGSASVSVTPLAPPGGEAFNVVMSVPLADSSGGTPRDLTSTAPVTVAEGNVCGNGVVELSYPTQITLEYFALPCYEYANYNVWINGTQVFNHLSAMDAPHYESCKGLDACGHSYAYKSVSTTNPTHLAAVAHGTNSIRFQMQPEGLSSHQMAWALLKITRPETDQYVVLHSGSNATAALSHSTDWCDYSWVYDWDATTSPNIDLLESCDNGMANATCGNCNGSCSGPFNICGDAVVRCGEVCDDGPGGTCLDDCTLDTCGDGVINGPEACDSGPDNGTCGFCNATCSGPHNACGDSQVLCGEICDDGPGGSCHDDCTAVNVCGDGLSFAGEICDDGADNGTCGHCNATCAGPHNVCGDGQVLCGEACDDGDATECGLCNATCTGPSPADFCGDGLVCGAEVCDDGDTTQCGLCNPFCTAASAADYCGDGLVCGAETCDDGNTASGDGCESDCQLICGAGTGAKKAALDAVSGDCFLGFDDVADWWDSQTLCEAISDGLATPSTSSGNAAAYLAATTNDAWIGIHDLTAEAGANGSLFLYVNGGFVAYNGWAVGEPNGNYAENCGHFLPPYGAAWNDSGCWAERSRVCEISHCGNGVIDAGEACDDGDATDCGRCNSNCSGPSPACGDGILGCGEACDDSNTLDGDGCESDCQLACGSGTGAWRAVYDVPNDICYLGVIASSDYYGAQAACAGLGGHLAILDSAVENVLAGQAAEADFYIGFNDILMDAGTDPFGFVNVLGGPLVYNGFGAGEPNNYDGIEDCVFLRADNLWNDVPCYTSGNYLCEFPSVTGVCGDGTHDLGEACDDGDTSDCGTCNADCSMAQLPDFCGDGRLCGGEVCDDGDNTECGDCNASCSGPSTHCGNGVLDCGEACDDGNLADGDGCESNCGLICGAGTGAWRAVHDSANDICYLGFTSTADFNGAQAACASRGGHLAILDSALENAFALQAAAAYFYIGFNDIAVEAGTDPFGFVNVLGGPLVYNGFGAGEPNDVGNEDCVFLRADGFWNDVPCDTPGGGHLCEFSNLNGVCGDGVHDLGEACDDGNATECGSCNATCAAPSPADTCGDGVLCGAEVCDDGPYNGYCGHCSISCDGPSNICGDGIARCGEACDDGNASTNDGCEPDCGLICGVGSGASMAVLNTMDGTCYLGFAATAPYLAQKDLCQDKGGYLAIIDSAAENSLADTVRIGTPYIGFNDLANEAETNAFGFKNVLGGDLIHNGFGPGEPNNGGNEDCVLLYPGQVWNDVPCSTAATALCEIPSNPGFCGDGVVNGAEECDDFANPSPCDGCMLNCRLTCGNGVVDCGEFCDDGDTSNLTPQCNAYCNGPTEPISAGSSNTCMVQGDNNSQLACWGRNDYGQSSAPGGAFISVSARSLHTCAIRTDNTVACWGGDNDYGEASPPSGTFRSARVGLWHTCGLRTDNSVACWGDNFSGAASPPAGGFLSVSAGLYHNCGVKTDNTVVCWGSNSLGQSSPPGGTFLSVSAGNYHNCGVRTDNTMACWGSNVFGESSQPGGTFQSVSAGGSHTCAIRTDNTVACWGDNTYSQSTPPGGTFLSIGAGGFHTCAIRTDNTVACWGSNGAGESTPP